MSDEQEVKKGTEENAEGKISTTEELKKFLLLIKDKMDDGVAAPIHSMTALNHVLTMPGIYGLLDAETREIARDIWLRMRRFGMQLNTPSMLFSPEEMVHHVDGAAF